MFVFTRSIFYIQLFRNGFEETLVSLLWEFNACFTAAGPSCGGHFVEIFCLTEHGRIKNWHFFWSNWMKKEHFLFSSNTQGVSRFGRKSAFTHPIVVQNNRLKNTKIGSCELILTWKTIIFSQLHDFRESFFAMLQKATKMPFTLTLLKASLHDQSLANQSAEIKITICPMLRVIG